MNQDLAAESRRAIQTTTVSSLNYVMLGLSLAAALSWVQAIRDFISTFVKVPKDMVGYQFLNALLLTLVAVLAYQFFSRWVPGVRQASIVGVVA